MTVPAWIMLLTTWTVIITFTVRFYAKALSRRPSGEDQEP